MRIAWISFDFDEYSIQQANALAGEHDVLLVLTNDVNDAHARALDATVEFYGFDRPRLRQPLRQVAAIRRILQRVHAFRPDVVHFQGGHLWFNFALPWLRRYPLVITIHDPRHHEGDASSRKTPQAVMDFGFRCADQVIVHGQQLVTTVHEAIGIARERIHVVPHVAIGDIAREDATAASDVEENDHSVLFFGRIWEYKGLDYLIKAAPLIAQRIPDVRIVIAGDGECFDRYRAMMHDPQSFEVHHGWISDEQRAELFQQTALVVLPYISATQSGVVPVAYTFGKPVVATRVGALPDCIDDGQTGLLVPARDERALADAIVTLLLDRPRRHAMGAAGRRKLQKECAPEVVARKTVEVYQQALRQRNSTRRERTPRSSPNETPPVHKEKVTRSA